MNYEKVSRLLKEYSSLIKSSGVENFEARKSCLESELRNVVLTGEEIVKKGILESLLSAGDSEISKRKIYALEKGIRNIGKKYRLLKKEYTELESEGTYEIEIEKIKSLIEGKQGTLIEEIRSIIFFCNV